MNKGLKITLIIILTFILLALIGVMVFLLNSNFKFDNTTIFSGQSNKLIEEKEFYDIKDLKITSNYSDVEIEEKDINNIKIELYSDSEEEHNITENTDNIEIVFKTKKKFGIMLFQKASVIKVYVPKTYNKDVEINNETGDIKINNLPDSNLNAKLTTGDIEVQQIRNANIALTTGDIEIDSVNELVSTSTTGDINIGTVNKMVSNTTTGDINVGSISKSLVLSTDTGDIKIEKATITVNSKISSGTGDVKIKTISGCYVDASTNIGDTKINNNDRKSDIELKITSRIGDIRVNY